MASAKIIQIMPAPDGFCAVYAEGDEEIVAPVDFLCLVEYSDCSGTYVDGYESGGLCSQATNFIEFRRIKEQSKNALVGKFFHSVEADGKIKWQGCILDMPAPGEYLVQLFEWLSGHPSIQRLASISQMENWLFYDDADEMISAYKERVARNGG